LPITTPALGAKLDIIMTLQA